MEFNTALLHKNFSGDKASGSTMTPIYQVSAFSHSSAEQLKKVFNNKAPGYAYSRIGNPTVTSFETRIAALENGAGAVACSSGMAAVTMALLNILESGDEIIVGAGLFGGTIDLLKDLEAFGITTHFADEITPQNIEPLINERTRAVFAELIGNPKLDIVDIEAVSNLAHRYNIPLIIDSTTATPYLVHPIDFGADIVVHSTSKYINGGGNAISAFLDERGRVPTYTVMLNPEIIKKDGMYDTEEGCLSLLGGPRPCKRYKSIKIKYQTLELQTRIKTYTGWTAQIIQHEIDHCNGILI